MSTRLRFTRTYRFAHEGIHTRTYEEGTTHDVTDAELIQMALSDGAAERASVAGMEVSPRTHSRPLRDDEEEVQDETDTEVPADEEVVTETTNKRKTRGR